MLLDQYEYIEICFNSLLEDNFMSKYDFDTWLNSQLGLNLTDIIANGFDVASDAELIAGGFRPEEEGISKKECAEFAIRVKTFMTLIKFGHKDIRVLESDWQSFKLFCEVMVKNKQIDKLILDQF